MKLKFYIFIAFLILNSFACKAEKAKEQSLDNNFIKIPEYSKNIKEKKKLPEVSAIYVTHPIYFAKAFTKEATYSYKTLIFFENGEWGRVYSYTGIDENGKYISIDSSEGVEYGNWKYEKGKLKITIKQCKCHHCVEEDVDINKDSNGVKQKDIEQNWDIQGKFRQKESLIIYKGKKYKYLKNEEIILNGLRDDLFEMDDKSIETVPCNVLEN